MRIMSMFDADPYTLSPEPAVAVSPGRRITLRNQQAIAAGKHPANGLPIDGTHTCGQCAHLDRGEYHNRSYLKCPFHRLGETHSEASDMRAHWPACPKFETG